VIFEDNQGSSNLFTNMSTAVASDVVKEEVEDSSKEEITGVKEKGVRKPVSKAVLRRRNNARIRKMAVPKSAVQILNELVEPKNVVTKTLGQPGMNGGFYNIQIETMGEVFTGCGPSAFIARNLACEAAVHHVAMKRFKEEQEMDTEQPSKAQDSTPWGALASLALFKLFNDWRNNGYTLPPKLVSKELEMSSNQSAPVAQQPMPANKMNSNFGPGPQGFRGMQGGGMQGGMQRGGKQRGGMQGGGMSNNMFQGMRRGFDFTDEAGAFHNFQHTGGSMGPMQQQRPGAKGAQKVKGEPAEKHPVTLLMEKNRENPPAFDCTEEGEAPNKIYTVTCTVGGETFSGQAKSKKEAKKQAATEAVMNLY